MIIAVDIFSWIRTFLGKVQFILLGFESEVGSSLILVFLSLILTRSLVPNFSSCI